MRSNSVLVRESDGKEFRVSFLSHWSLISSDDGESDSVKWYGPGYVGFKGNTYVLKQQNG